MKLLYDFYPKIGDTTSATITYTGAESPTYFNSSNLFTIEPVKCFKSGSNSGVTITIDLLSSKLIDTVFLNRINFSSYSISYSTDNANWLLFGTPVSGIDTDEIKDENYVHNITVLKTPVTARYIRITPSDIMFSDSFFKIGNIMIGKSVEVSNPKNGFQVKYIPSMSITQFKSGYITSEKLGRTRRSFSGDFDKLSTEEMNKIRLTYKPLVLYLDYTDDTSSCYLVMNTEEFTQSYDFAKVKSMNFTFEEIV